MTAPIAPPAHVAAFDALGAGLGAESIAARQLATVADQIRRITGNAEVRILSRDKSELDLRLEPKSWCVAECLDHLAHTTRSFLPTISDAIAEAPKLTTNRRLRTGILPSLFIRNLNPPYRIRFKVLPQLIPQNTDSETAWTSFLESQSELLETVLSATDLAIDEVRIKSPVYARISYNIFGVLRMLVAYQNRHIWQIDQILSALDNRLTSGIA